MKNLSLAIVGVALIAATLITPRFVLGETLTIKTNRVDAYASGSHFDPATNTQTDLYANGTHLSTHVLGGEHTAFSSVTIYYSSVKNSPDLRYAIGYFGNGVVTDISVEEDLRSGEMGGHIKVNVLMLDRSTGIITDLGTEDVEVSFKLKGVGAIEKTKGSEPNGSFSSSYRTALVTPVVNCKRLPWQIDGYLSIQKFVSKLTIP